MFSIIQTRLSPVRGSFSTLQRLTECVLSDTGENPADMERPLSKPPSHEEEADPDYVRFVQEKQLGRFSLGHLKSFFHAHARS